MKTKIIVLVGIALCTMLLISPALASDAGTLEIYGNANEDDTIDMRDLTYVKLIFFGKKPVTELADAKYDGKINPLDFIQIKLIIVGKEKEITIVDASGEDVTVSMPIDRIIVLNSDFADAVRAVGARDKVVGVCEGLSKMYFPEISTLPTVGGWMGPDIEMVLSLEPDIVCCYATWPPSEGLEDKLAGTGITVIRLEFYKTEILKEEMMKLGYILGEEEKADEYISFFDEYVGVIEERVAELPEEEKPRVYVEIKDYKAVTEEAGGHQLCVMAGGINVFADLGGGGYVEIDPEDVIVAHPDIILRQTYYDSGYDEDDPTEIIALSDNILDREVLADVPAIKDKRVYVISNQYAFGPDSVAGLVTIAKWFHRELFIDLDPQAIHQEYIDEFCEIDYDVTEHGVFVYPSPES
jgi:iron complex transport system substrate-binding protein